jgi:hypothetical protein
VNATEEEPEDEATVAVGRVPVDAADDTVAVTHASRVSDDNDETIAVGARAGSGQPESEHADDTVAVTRAPFSPPPGEEGSDTTIGLGRTGRGNRLARPDPRHRRRGIKPPPVPEGFAPLPVEGLGPWGVEEYPARAIVAPPALLDTDADPAPPRQADPALSSVRRHARRSARRALVVFWSSCVVLIAAVTALVVWLV